MRLYNVHVNRLTRKYIWGASVLVFIGLKAFDFFYRGNGIRFHGLIPLHLMINIHLTFHVDFRDLIQS